VEVNEDNRAYSLQQVMRLCMLPGFPKEREGVRSLAESYCRFVSKEPATHSLLGTVIPAEWVIQYCLATCHYSPTPFQMRVLYARYFPPDDGLEMDDPEEDNA